MIGGLLMALLWVAFCSPTITSLGWEIGKMLTFGLYRDEVIREREKWYRILFPFMWKHGAPFGAGLACWMLAEAWRLIQVKPTEPPEVL